MSTHLAIDIGGSRGRVFLGTQDGEKWSTEFLGDFSTQPLKQNGRLCWDVLHIFSSICYYIQKAAKKVLCLDTIAIDTMGVAFALLDSSCRLIELPPYTRTAQSPQLIDEIVHHFTPDGLYQINGLEQQKLNSLYYLHQIAQERPFILKKAAHFLMLPDLLNYWLTGVIESEYTIASTSALWDISKNDWSDQILNYVHLSKDIFPKVVHAPAIVAPLKEELISSASLSRTKVIHVCSHDTASACAYVSTFAKNNVFISAGTYGIIGAVTATPC